MKSNMKILLVYFTGTYNTLYLTTIIKNKLLSKNNYVDVVDINQKTKINVSQYDVIGIGYPINIFSAPKNLLVFLKKASIKNTRYFIYKTGSFVNSLNHASSAKLISLMKKSNNVFVGEYHYLMPSNILCKIKDDFVKYMMEYNYKQIDYMINNLNQSVKYKTNFLKNIMVCMCQVVRPFLILKVRRFRVDKSKCIRCRRCINSCPNKNITYDKSKRRIVFKGKCILCARCVLNCPTNAIKTYKLEKSLNNGKYDYLAINNLENTYSFNQECDKTYLKYTKYFESIDKMIK